MEHDAEMATWAIEIICPRCGASSLDDYELLDAGCVHAMVCESCGGRFSLTIFDCDDCGAETVLRRDDSLDGCEVQESRCATCGAPASWP